MELVAGYKGNSLPAPSQVLARGPAGAHGTPSRKVCLKRNILAVYTGLKDLLLR